MSQSLNNNDIGWNFPPTNGGVQADVNNEGLAHFTGNRLHHLAREILQNSLDARLNTNLPVQVAFEVRTLETRKVPGVEELIEHISICIEECGNNKQEESAELLKNARSIFIKDKIFFLVVHDSNTTGLKYNWDALLKGAGTSIKSSDSAGGSHGIGKNAVYVLSDAKTAFYWSAFEKSESDSQLIENFQGKSIMKFHNFDGEQRQGVGFWGQRDKCKKLVSDHDSIPNDFRIIDVDGNPIQGTAIWIAGFNPDNDWQYQVARHVIENFFCAIEKDLISVTFSSQEDDITCNKISSKTLDNWLERLEVGEEENSIREIKQYLRFIRNGKPKVLDDPDLGQCKLWIAIDDIYPRTVALVRNTGMLITTSQNRLVRFRNVNDFLALCYFDSPQGNKLLRKMENPQHNAFSADILPEKERNAGNQILNRLIQWIRDSINEVAKKYKKTSSSEINELSRYLPLKQSDELVDTDGEKAFGQYGEISKRRIKLKPLPSPVSETVDDPDPDPDPNPNPNPVPHPYPNPNPNPNPNPDPNPKHPIVGKNFEIEDVRVVPVSSNGGFYKVSFTPKGNAKIELTYCLLGDQSPTKLTNVVSAKLSSSEKLEIDPDPPILEVETDRRVSTFIYVQSPATNHAWLVLANEKIG